MKTLITLLLLCLVGLTLAAEPKQTIPIGGERFTVEEIAAYIRVRTALERVKPCAATSWNDPACTCSKLKSKEPCHCLEGGVCTCGSTCSCAAMKKSVP